MDPILERLEMWVIHYAIRGFLLGVKLKGARWADAA